MTDRMEPEAVAFGDGCNQSLGAGGQLDEAALAASNGMAIMSIAISLKRIADALEGPDAGRSIADNLYHGISNALFEAWQRGAPPR